MQDVDFLPLIYEALGRVNAIRTSDTQIPRVPDVLLTGENGMLDSFALTTLVLALEECIRERTGQEISLMQEGDFDALTREFSTPLSIAKLISSKV